MNFDHISFDFTSSTPTSSTVPLNIVSNIPSQFKFPTTYEDTLNQALIDLTVNFTEDTKEWAEAAYQHGMNIKMSQMSPKCHEDAIPFLMKYAKFHQSIDILSLLVTSIDDEKIKSDVLKEGIDWPYSSATDWSKWKYYDELSVVGWYNGAKEEATKAFHILMKHKEYPSEHAARIEGNAQFFESADYDTSYQTLTEKISQLSEETKLHSTSMINKVPSILHLIFLNGGVQF